MDYSTSHPNTNGTRLCVTAIGVMMMTHDDVWIAGLIFLVVLMLVYTLAPIVRAYEELDDEE